MNRLIVLSVLTVLTVLTLCGCATLLNQEQAISFSSDIDDTQVYINDTKICKTPCSTVVEFSKKPIWVKATKIGYEDTKGVIMAEGISGFFWLNFLATSPMSTTIDIATGRMFKYSPDLYYFTMIKEGENSNVLIDSPISFLVYNIQNLRSEAVRGGGEYVNTLAGMLEITTESLNQMIIEYSDNDLLKKVKDIHRKQQQTDVFQ